MSITRKERGWAGHFICAYDCAFRRNTLVSNGDRHIVVSTVGSMRRNGKGKPVEIGAFGRLYETMVFIGYQDGAYIEADVTKQVWHQPKGVEWAISSEDVDALPDDVDSQADTMHEQNVEWVMGDFDNLYHAAMSRGSDE